MNFGEKRQVTGVFYIEVLRNQRLIAALADPVECFLLGKYSTPYCGIWVIGDLLEISI